MSNLVPMVLESDGNSRNYMDIYSALLKERVVFLNGPVTQQSAALIVAQLFYLDYQDPFKPINFYINSEGGSCYAGIAIHDCMKRIRSKVHTTCLGIGMSMGSFLLMSGEPGQRRASENSTIMIHSVASSTSGRLGDMLIDMEETQRLNNLLTNKYVEYCNKGKDFDFFYKAMRHDNFLTPQQALDIGLIDEIVK